ncbi:hypothetical protein LJR234_005476 [Mesorhizobium amorphae]|uniref:hypothetical protein n=1 Tax=Mesorhizobium amorphae TaxID=71433 RepID=UPI003ECE819A
MQWLTALLAFATTMLMFAIVVSTLVEMIHRIFGLRAKGMQLMLGNLYSRVILPKLTKSEGDAKELLTPQQFAALIMENRATTEKGDPSTGWISGFLRWFVDWAVVTDIPVEVFTQKLASSRLVGAADVLTDEVVMDISQKYEAFGKEVSLYFESRARLFSVCVAFFVAWTFYVHPYKLAVAFLKNPEIAGAVAEKAADVHAQYAVLMEKLNTAAAANPETGTGSTEDLKGAIAALQEKLTDAENQTKELRTLGAPVGWEVNPALKSCALGAVTVDCSFGAFGTNWTLPSIANAFWLLVGGLLVGLGAPFWAQAVSSLTASRDVSRRIAEIVSPKGVATATAAVPQDATPQPDSVPVTTFKVARAAGQKNVAK